MGHFLFHFLNSFCIPFTLSQHEMTKLWAWGPQKNCRAKIQDGRHFSRKSHFRHNFVFSGCLYLIEVSNHVVIREPFSNVWSCDV